MPTSIVIQQLAVSQYLDPAGLEALRYAPGTVAGLDGQAPLPANHVVHLERVKATNAQVRDVVRQLADLAARGEPRRGLDIAPTAQRLAGLILPPGGIIGLVAPELHPQFDLAGDVAGDIPWEVLEERFATCRCQNEPKYVLLSTTVPPPPCPRCHKPMEPAGGKLALERHLTHLVRYSRRTPTGQGRDFLLVVDPTSDLLTEEHDPLGRCAEHISRLEDVLKISGFKPIVRKRGFATVDTVMTALQSPTLVGFYYFGHGEPPNNRRPGSLVLSDGRLYADEIAALDTTPRLVFLNACWAGSGGVERWSLESRASSVGEALARGGPKVVVASLFPVVNTQAARVATTFFDQALAGKSLAEALRAARLESHAAYVAGEADVGWMAFRYFGDPNQVMPQPQPTAANAAGADSVPSVFDENDRLVCDQFGFDIRGVLLRAAARRTQQHRPQVSLLDLLTGLVRAGQVTRLCWRELGYDPDEACSRLRALLETEASSAASNAPAAEPDEADASPADRLMRLVAQWIVRQRTEFAPDVMALFNTASAIAHRAGRSAGDARITEYDVLQALAATAAWPTIPAVVPFGPNDLRKWLERFSRQRLLDHNGSVRLERLAADARRIIERAHELAQQRGQKYVPSRLLLASFLSDSNGVAAQLCRQAGASPVMLELLLVAMTKGETPTTFPLSMESCQRAVLPLLREVGLDRPEARETPITEEQLFRAFCRASPRELKELFRTDEPPWRLDLDELACLELQPSDGLPQPEPEQSLSERRRAPPKRAPAPQPPAPSRAKKDDDPDRALSSLDFSALGIRRLDTGAQLALKAALQFAAAQGHAEIRSPHMFAGLLCVETGTLLARLRSHGIAAGQAIASALSSVYPQPAREPKAGAASVAVSPNVAQWLKAAAALAVEQEATELGERQLASVLVDSPPQVVGSILQHLGFEFLTNEGNESTSQESARSSATVTARAWDLMALARRGSLPTIIGRQALVSQLLACLVERPAARVALCGPRGVGKSTLVAAAAQAIASDVAPAALEDCRFIDVSVAEITGNGRFWADGVQQLRLMLTNSDDKAIVYVRDAGMLLTPLGILEGVSAVQCPGRIVLGITAVQIAPGMFTAAGSLKGFQRFDVPPVPSGEIHEILMARRQLLESRFNLHIQDDALAVAALHAGIGLPGSAIGLLERACETAVAEGRDNIGKKELENALNP